MNVALCLPPDAIVPTMPFGALPLFQACLKQHGHEVVPIDLSITTFHWLVQPEHLQAFYDYADGLTDRQAKAGLGRALAIPRDRVLGAAQALRDLRDPAVYYDADRMLESWSHIHAAVEVLSLIRPRLDPRNQSFVEDLFAKLEDGSLNIWNDAFDATVRQRLEKLQPQLIALTAPFSTQILPAMLFAAWAKKTFPKAKIVAGGTGFSDGEDAFLREPKVYDYLDFVCVSDGEDALPQLAAALEKGQPVDDVPGLLQCVDGEVQGPVSRGMVDMDTTPTPDFTGIDFDLYPTPERVACLTTSRGCYYGKCSFCPESFRLRFRRRSSARVWEDMKDFVQRQGITNFAFWDPLTPPAVLTAISQRSVEEKIEINWTAEVKFERMYADPDYVRTLADGGCRYLQFGFESGVQHVLDGMDKGNDLAQIDVILDRLGEVGINVGVFFFIGFPTETEDDARETWRYLIRNRERIAYAGYIGTFGLGHDVPVFKTPERFGIDVVYDEAGNPQYQRRDGKDWNFDSLHNAYAARSDLFMIENSIALLYSHQNPEISRQLAARMRNGPPSFVRQAETGPVTFPVDHGTHSLPLDDGSERHWAYVARSSKVHEISAEELAVVEAVRSGQPPAKISASPAGRAALVRLIDLGIVERPAFREEDVIARPSEGSNSDALAS